jgi:diguanylate cyclase (GGDEF)-like protein
MTFFVLHVTIGLGGQRLDTFASVWVYDALEVLAVVAVTARAVLEPRERMAWALFAAGIASWTLGDIAWTAVYGGNPPYPSFADVLYLGFYPPTFLALALLVRSRVSRFNASVWLDGVMAALAAAAVGAAVLLEVVLKGTESQLLATATDLAYPLGDIVLVALVAGVFGITGWRPGRAWTAIGAALLLTAIADSIYLYQTAVGTYTAGTILDALWPASLLLIAGAAWLVPERRTRVQLEGRPLVAAPAVCGLIATAVLVDGYLEHRNAVCVALAVATLVTVFARMLLTLSENARITRDVHELALTDSLTGLGNRRALLAELESVFAAEHVEHSLLVVFDLNGFKSYNDMFGHPAGDALLRRLAKKLAESVAPYGACYRLGGDEFCALAGLGSSQLEAFIAATTNALAERGDSFEVSTAFGCVFLPEEAADSSEALRVADQRLYLQKYELQMARSRPHRVLLQALYEREPGLREHVDGVTTLSLRVGRMLGLAEGALEELELAAELHDIGKLAIPDATLAKPGPLDEDEWALIQGHTIVGERILNASPALNRVGRIVRATHECWDGTGYPDGLHGTDIPLPARIIAVCDAYSAMIGDRPHRPPLTPGAALSELRRCAGSQFDPEIVDVFIAGRVAEPLESVVPAS